MKPVFLIIQTLMKIILIFMTIDTEINDKSDRDDPDTNNKEISDNNLNYHLFNYINIIIMKKKITVNHILEQYLQTSMIKIII